MQGKIIKGIYTSKGLTLPKGKGEHTPKFHRIASNILKKESKGRITPTEKRIAYATAMKVVGRNKAVNKSHQR